MSKTENRHFFISLIHHPILIHVSSGQGRGHRSSRYEGAKKKMTNLPRDPGDEVQRRFRYQINYAALKALQMLTHGSQICAVYCEHLDDVLIEASNGLFTGIQVKTRELDQRPFRLSDNSVFGTLKRFCVRDARYPGQFERFVFATNFVFLDDDIEALLNCCRDNPTLEGVAPRHKVRKSLASLADSAGMGLEQVIAALSKVRLEERMTGIDQPELDLVRALGEIETLGNQSFFELHRIAEAIRSHIWNVSSLALDGYVLETHAVVEDFVAHVDELRTRQKRLDRELMVSLATPTASDHQELLSIREFIERESIPPGLGRMELKMAAGDIGYADVEQMKDDVASLERTFLGWKEKFGLAEANRRLAHFQHLANRASREAESQTSATTGAYGQAMLTDLRERTRTMANAEKDTLFGCRSEHLVGTAGLLSEECKVWWSADRDFLQEVSAA
jgi:Cap4 dsDNA endonuclease